MSQSPSSNQKTRAFWDFWGPILCTLSLYTGIRHFIAEVRYIPSGSMIPGLQIHDRLVIEKLSLGRRSPRRGEIVVFNSPYSFDKVLSARKQPSNLKCALVTFPLVAAITGLRDPSCDAYIKRVVAVAGDEVSVNGKGEVLINQQLLDEPYVSNYCSLNRYGVGRCNTFEKKVPIGHVLVLGDNRANSWDGRLWPGGGFLPEGEILGRAVWRFWPIDRFGSLSL